MALTQLFSCRKHKRMGESFEGIWDLVKGKGCVVRGGHEEGGGGYLIIVYYLYLIVASFNLVHIQLLRRHPGVRPNDSL